MPKVENQCTTTTHREVERYSKMVTALVDELESVLNGHFLSLFLTYIIYLFDNNFLCVIIFIGKTFFKLAKYEKNSVIVCFINCLISH